MAKVAGSLVIALFFAGMVASTVVKHGWSEAIATWGLALFGTFAVAWAIGAIIHDDWWPFRHL